MDIAQATEATECHSPTLSEMPTASNVLLPEGMTDEPPGWRDERGWTPIDALDRYLHDRFEVERWAWAEERKTSIFGRGGQLTEADLNIVDGINMRLRELAERHLTPEALARWNPSNSNPSEHDPKKNRVLSVSRRRHGIVAVTVQYRLPRGYAPADHDTSLYRYDFVKRHGEWRLGNRLAPQPGSRPIGGLL